MAGLLIVAYAIFGVMCGAFASSVAESKGHSSGSWFLLGFLFGPLALLASVGLADVRLQREVAAPSSIVNVVEDTQEDHEHVWIRASAPKPFEAITLEGCAICGLIKNIHRHRWTDPLLLKDEGRLYQSCPDCKVARYIN